MHANITPWLRLPHVAWKQALVTCCDRKRGLSHPAPWALCKGHSARGLEAGQHLRIWVRQPPCKGVMRSETNHVGRMCWCVGGGRPVPHVALDTTSPVTATAHHEAVGFRETPGLLPPVGGAEGRAGAWCGSSFQKRCRRRGNVGRKGPGGSRWVLGRGTRGSPLPVGCGQGLGAQEHSGERVRTQAGPGSQVSVLWLLQPVPTMSASRARALSGSEFWGPSLGWSEVPEGSSWKVQGEYDSSRIVHAPPANPATVPPTPTPSSLEGPEDARPPGESRTLPAQSDNRAAPAPGVRRGLWGFILPNAPSACRPGRGRPAGGPLMPGRPGAAGWTLGREGLRPCPQGGSGGGQPGPLPSGASCGQARSPQLGACSEVGREPSPWQRGASRLELLNSVTVCSKQEGCAAFRRLCPARSSGESNIFPISISFSVTGT